MTETEWEENDSLTFGFWGLDSTCTDRKVRLFSVACLRTSRALFSDPAADEVIAALERFADGTSTHDSVYNSLPNLDTWNQGQAPHEPIRQAVLACLDTWPDSSRSHLSALQMLIDARVRGEGYNYSHPLEPSVRWKVQLEFLNLLRCIIGNPFRPVAFDPRWRSETAVALATGIYDGRHFDRLPILADALEEAGCDHPDILAHCRGAGPHARGCWVVDLALGKS